MGVSGHQDLPIGDHGHEAMAITLRVENLKI
jgi:hypothetical protein